MAESEDDTDFDDVDGIVDPLAGLRDEEEDFNTRFSLRPADNGRRNTPAEPLDLDASFAEDDENAAPLSPLQSKPQGRRRVLPGESGDDGAGRGAGSGAAGSTLFERMANLSRGAKVDDEDEDDDAAPALNIPRFLNRQNNQ